MSTPTANNETKKMTNFNNQDLLSVIQRMKRGPVKPSASDEQEAREFADLTAKFGVDFRMEEPRLVYGTLGDAGETKQIWKLTGADKTTVSEKMLEFDPRSARRMVADYDLWPGQACTLPIEPES